MKGAPASRKARQSARTREALVTQSLALVAERGLSRTSIDHIAKAAGVTKGAMYWHFASKDDLFLAILDRIRDRWQHVVHARVSARQTPTDRLSQLFESYGELFRESPEICLFMQQALLDQHNRKHSAQVARVFASTARFIADIIDTGKTTGEIRPEVDPMTIAHMILGMLAGASQQATISRSQPLRKLLSAAKAMTLAYVAR